MIYLSLLLLVTSAALVAGLAGAVAGKLTVWLVRAEDATFRRLFMAALAGGGLAAVSLVAARFLILDPRHAVLSRYAGLALAAATLIALVLAGTRAAAWKRFAVGLGTLVPAGALAAGFARSLDLLAMLVISFVGLAGGAPPAYDLPAAGDATPREIRSLERTLPHVLDRLTWSGGEGWHGSSHQNDPLLEKRLWPTVSALPIWQGGGEWLLEIIDRVYLAYHVNYYHGWIWHYPYFDCSKAIALARKIEREYRDPRLQEEALWRQAFCYRVRGLDAGEKGAFARFRRAPYADYARHYPSAAAQAKWRSDLDRARELLAELIERFPAGSHRAEAEALLRFEFAEIARPVSFLAQPVAPAAPDALEQARRALPGFFAEVINGQFVLNPAGGDFGQPVPDLEIARRALRLAVEALDDPDPEIRSRLAMLFGNLAAGPSGQFGSGPRAFDVEAEAEARLRLMLDDPAPGVRRAAAGHLGLLYRPLASSTLARLVDAVADGDAGVRRRAASSLEKAGASGAVPQLIAASGDADPSVRRAAAKALGMLAREDAVPALVALIEDPDLEVQVAAISALAWLQQDAASAVDRLAELVLGDDPGLGFEAPRAIDRILAWDDPRLHELSANYAATHGLRARIGGWNEARREAEAQAIRAAADPERFD